MALRDADRDKLWDLAYGRCAIGKERLIRPGFPAEGGAVPAVEFRIRQKIGDLILPDGFLDGYENYVLLCEADSEVARELSEKFTPAKLLQLKASHENRPVEGVTLTLHQAVFGGSTNPLYFLKVTNFNRHPIQLNRLWFATDPQVTVNNADRPLPTRIAPGELFETWIPVRSVPPRHDIAYLARADVEGIPAVDSQPHVDVAPAGQVGGGGSPLTSLVRSVAAMNHEDGRLIEKAWDVFISYASRDRTTVVEPLAVALKERGLRVWYDGFEMRLGDSLRRKIDEGIRASAFGVLILSPEFFVRKWTNYELDGLVTQSHRGQVLLPVWHHVSEDDVAAYSPFLADKVACNTANNNIDQIADLIHQVISKATS
jgi:hypothetical protein